MKIIFKIMMLYNNKGRLKHDCFRRPWIRISSATLVYQWLEQIQE